MTIITIYLGWDILISDGSALQYNKHLFSVVSHIVIIPIYIYIWGKHDNINFDSFVIKQSANEDNQSISDYVQEVFSKINK